MLGDENVTFFCLNIFCIACFFSPSPVPLKGEATVSAVRACLLIFLHSQSVKFEIKSVLEEWCRRNNSLIFFIIKTHYQKQVCIFASLRLRNLKTTSGWHQPLVMCFLNTSRDVALQSYGWERRLCPRLRLKSRRPFPLWFRTPSYQRIFLWAACSITANTKR